MLRLAAALALMLFALPASAQRFSEVATFQIRSMLGSVAVPIYASGQTVSGVSARYSAGTSGCITQVQIEIPPYSAGGTNYPAGLETVSIDWRQVQNVGTSNGYVVVRGPGLPGDGQYLYAGSEIHAAELRAYMLDFSGACYGPAALRLMGKV